MLKLFGNGGSQTPRSVHAGKRYRVNEHHVVVEDVLAEGGFALVFQVRASHGRRYALKRVAVNSKSDLFLLHQEIAITKALSDCPHSVTYVNSAVHRLGQDVFEVLILMEIYTGGRLLDVLNERLALGGLSEPVVLRIFTDICRPVARLHHRTKPITHRDLKIENVLRDAPSGNYVLCDYGSCSVTPMHPDVLGASVCEEQIGRFTTLAYRSPEMVDLYCGKTISTKADVWALGCLLYKLCFFTTPFGENPLAIMGGSFSFPDDSPFSPELHALISYMLEPDPDRRPTIWQVAEAAHRLRQTENPVPNVFHSPRPPPCLPASPRQTPRTSSTPKQSRQNEVPQLSITISSRERPRAAARPRQPRHVSPEPRPPSMLCPPTLSPEHSCSMDSGLDAFGAVPFSQTQAGGTNKRDVFGSMPFSDTPPLGVPRKALSHSPPLGGPPRKDTPPLGGPPRKDTPPMGGPLRKDTPPLGGAQWKDTTPLGGALRKDLFGATPFSEAPPTSMLASVDAFGASPFVPCPQT